MERLPNESEYEWIRSALPELGSAEDPAWEGNLVAHCLPLRYEKYLKLLHPVYEDLTVSDHDLTWDDVVRAQRAHGGAAMTDNARLIVDVVSKSGGVTRQSMPTESFLAKRIMWRDLAKRWGRVYHPAITDRGLVPSLTSWPRYLVGPAEGNLDTAQRAELAETLAPHTADQECFYWWMTIAQEESMWRGRLEDYPRADEVQHDRRCPNMVWPKEHVWCICTDYDLCFTLIGCSSSAAAALFSRPELELLEVRPNTRIDYKADEVNAGRN